TRADLRLLPGATCVWALAVLGVTAGGAAAIAAGAVLVSLALTALTLLGPARGARTILAHLALVLLAGLLLIPALHRHDGTADALVVGLTVSAGSDPAPPSGGPEWSRTGLQMMARTAPGPARIGRTQEQLTAAVPVLVRADGEAAEGLARIRDGEPVHARGRVSGDASLLVLRATEVGPAQEASGGVGPGQETRHRLRQIARDATAHLPPDEAALVRGMTTGDTSGMGEQTDEIMHRAGISHLVAVSGANIALVLAAVLGPLLLAGVRRRPRLLIAAAVVAGYVWLVGDEPSVQRAATMAAPLLA